MLLYQHAYTAVPAVGHQQPFGRVAIPVGVSNFALAAGAIREAGCTSRYRGHCGSGRKDANPVVVGVCNINTSVNADRDTNRTIKYAHVTCVTVRKTRTPFNAVLRWKHHRLGIDRFDRVRARIGDEQGFHPYRRLCRRRDQAFGEYRQAFAVDPPDLVVLPVGNVDRRAFDGNAERLADLFAGAGDGRGVAERFSRALRPEPPDEGDNADEDRRGGKEGC